MLLAIRGDWVACIHLEDTRGTRERLKSRAELECLSMEGSSQKASVFWGNEKWKYLNPLTSCAYVA